MKTRFDYKSALARLAVASGGDVLGVVRDIVADLTFEEEPPVLIAGTLLLLHCELGEKHEEVLAVSQQILRDRFASYEISLNNGSFSVPKAGGYLSSDQQEELRVLNTFLNVGKRIRSKSTI